MSKVTEAEQLSVLSTDVKYIVKSIDELQRDFKSFQKDVVNNYAKKEDIDVVKSDIDAVDQRLTYTNKTLTGTIVSFLLSVTGFFLKG